MKRSIALIALVFNLVIAQANDANGIPLTAQKKITVIIDAGHGGDDPGYVTTIDSFMQEKDLNLAISQQFGAQLKAAFPNRINIIYTRTSDVSVALENRVSVANSKKADYFISIHCNASENLSASGPETHIHNADSKVALELAKQIQGQLASIPGRTNRGVKVRHDRGYNLMVLKSSKMPAVLIECGFMTNSLEEIFLNSEDGQTYYAKAIFKAFSDYIKVKHGIEPDLLEVKPVFKIQIMASKNQVFLPNPIKEEEMAEEMNVEGDFPYKYYVGSFATKKEARKELKKMKGTSFKDAFIVRFE